LHYLCAGYSKFFRHIRKYLRAMTTLLEHGVPVAEVMKAVEGPLLVRQSRGNFQQVSLQQETKR
jgi:uncharacterized protein